jgi:hypothetical protein
MNKDLTFTEDQRSKNRETAIRDRTKTMPIDETLKEYVDRSVHNRRAAEFQAMHNPAQMTQFEQTMVNQEKNSRQDARRNYIRGVQGRDGGDRCDDYQSKFEDGPETN